MKQAITLFLTAFLFSPLLNAGVQEASSSYEVPTYDIRRLSVVGQDFLSLDSEGAMGINLGSDLIMDQQDPSTALTISNSLGVDLNQAESGADLTSEVTDDFAVRYQRFFDGSRGFSAYGAATAGVGLVDDVGAGAGYGRLLNATSVAQAAAMFEVLGRSASSADLLRVAEVIGKRSSYSADDVYSGAVHFNAALSDAFGGVSATESHQLLQVLDSPIYVIGSRRVGWEVTAGLNSDLGDVLADGASTSNEVSQGFQYGMLMSDTMGFHVSETLTKALSDGAATDVALSAGFNLDHSIRWNTNAGLNVDVTLPDGGEMALGWSLGAGTSYVVGSNLVAGAGVNVNQKQDEDLGWDVSATFTYYIW